MKLESVSVKIVLVMGAMICDKGEGSKRGLEYETDCDAQSEWNGKDFR